jgi:hypothetical protein
MEQHFRTEHYNTILLSLSLALARSFSTQNTAVQFRHEKYAENTFLLNTDESVMTSNARPVPLNANESVLLIQHLVLLRRKSMLMQIRFCHQSGPGGSTGPICCRRR